MTDTKTLTQKLKEAGLRLTPQRLAICEALAGTEEHPSAQMVYEQLQGTFPSLSLATVYNTLETLVQIGAINRLGTAGNDAERYDADTSPHVNLACISCHRVIDLPSRNVQALDEEVARNSGYQVLGARVLYYGLCPECQAKEGRER